MNLRNKILMTFTMTIVLPLFAMDSDRYYELVRDLESDYNSSTKMERIKAESKHNSFTCKQVAGILKAGFLYNSSDRYKALEYLSLKIEDIENKQVIIDKFSEAYDSSGKQKAIVLLSEISPAKKPKETEPESKKVLEKIEDAVELKGKIALIKEVSYCRNTDNDVFHFDDMVTLSFQANKSVGVTKLSQWISGCDTINDKSCRTPYIKKEQDILPDWKGLKNHNPVKLRKIMTNSGKIPLPQKFQWFNFVVIIKDNIVAEKMYKILDECQESELIKAPAVAPAVR